MRKNKMKMQGIRKKLDADDLIMLIMLAADEKGGVNGRTAIQKIGYFSVQRLKIANDYMPHYYGPYSPQIAATVNQVCSLNLVDENVIITNNERRLYTYSLSADGRKYAKTLAKKFNKAYKEIKKIVESADKIRGDRIESLSCAAKIHYLATHSKERLTVDSARKKAQSLGWNLSSEQIIDSVDILKKLNTVG